MNTTDNTPTPPPIPPPKSVPSPREKNPNLLWRRLAAIAVDMLILDLFIWIGTAVTGTFVFGLFLAWFGFFVLWYMLTIKRESTAGTALAGILIRLAGTGTDKSPRLLLRFAVTWIPLLFLSLPAFEIGQGEQPLLVTLLQWIALLWYIALFIGLMATRGKGGIQDAICKSQSEFRISEPLSGGRKAVIWMCTVMLVLETGFSMLPLDDDSPEKDGSNVPIAQGTGLSFESLQIAAHTVFGGFRELDLLEDDVFQWNGTASVISKDGGKLYLVSNSHVLGLLELAQSDDSSDMIPEINAYALGVTFATGKEVPVLRFGDQAGALDLSLLEVDSAGLVEGRDYVIVPYDEAIQIHVGDEAVAVGSPHGLAGTHTFGRISAVRDFDQGEPYRAFQTDAAINPGNSGGPLFVKKHNSYKWIGVNTFGVGGGDSLGFAIDACHVWKSKWYWYPATREGARDAVTQNYQRNAIIE